MLDERGQIADTLDAALQERRVHAKEANVELQLVQVRLALLTGQQTLVEHLAGAQDCIDGLAAHITQSLVGSSQKLLPGFFDEVAGEVSDDRLVVDESRQADGREQTRQNVQVELASLVTQLIVLNGGQDQSNTAIFSKRAQILEESAGGALGWPGYGPDSLVAWEGLNEIVESLVELTIEISLVLRRHGAILGDLRRVERDVLVEARTETLIRTTLIGPLGSLNVDTQTDGGHGDCLAVLFEIKEFDDVRRSPLIRVILAIDEIVHLERGLPGPDVLRLTFERSQLVGPDVELAVSRLGLEQVVERDLLAFDLSDLGLRPAGTATKASRLVIVMEQSVDFVANLQLGAPLLSGAFGEQLLDLGVADLEVNSV